MFDFCQQVLLRLSCNEKTHVVWILIILVSHLLYSLNVALNCQVGNHVLLQM